MKLHKTIGILVATTALLVLGAQPMLAIGGLRTTSAVTPASATSFGAKLDANGELSNGYSGEACPSAGACTRVMNRAYNGGTVEAPKAGYVSKIKLIGGVPGSFRLFFVKVKPGTTQAKAVAKGATISYTGNADNNAPMKIETFDIADIHVEKGWRLAIKSTTTSIIRCDSGNGSYTYQPGLAVGAAYVDLDDNSSCALMIQAIYR